jgi:hypothetical protein
MGGGVCGGEANGSRRLAASLTGSTRPWEGGIGGRMPAGGLTRSIRAVGGDEEAEGHWGPSLGEAELRGGRDGRRMHKSPAEALTRSIRAMGEGGEAEGHWGLSLAGAERRGGEDGPGKRGQRRPSLAGSEQHGRQVRVRVDWLLVAPPLQLSRVVNVPLVVHAPASLVFRIGTLVNVVAIGTEAGGGAGTVSEGV